ncbi:TonB-dependent receptor plug domain-containing protein [Flavobacterium sp. NG2]|uniref:TonB-dependent receptor plug domain-containing protein n=1 Tax=Flavobacterium sp. NG2 TaxID=3097547 RepID=UPI002A8402AE|nr:TonB-dependent receptor [Flavobacterium sp. NG2]WPR73038.1 TonB-dependent receptor plug domain-containing protein [Flavobacterium sp. NG2]
MNKKIVRISMLCLLIGASTFAQKKGAIAVPNELNEVVISDSKFALPKEKSGKVIVKITAEDLAKREGQSLATVLSSVAGVEINGNQSNAGRNLGVYIRGSRTRQTLILIDGVPVSDASGINLEYDLRLLPVEQVESVEIMKGASSTLYGSGAAAGVINITLKKGTKKDISGTVYLNTGTQVTADKTNYSPKEFNQGFNFGAKNEKINYFASLNSSAVQGISEVKGVDFEDDLFQRVNSVVKLGFTPTKKLSLDFSANYDRIKNEFDDVYDNFNNPDSPVNVSTSEQFRLGFSPKYKYNKGELVLNSSFNMIERGYNVFNSRTKKVDPSEYKSRNVNVDAFNKYQFCKQFFAVLGSQFQFQEMNSQTVYGSIAGEMAKFNTVDPYFTAVYNSDFGLNVNLGGRYNIHSVYGEHLVYNINPSFSFSDLPLKLLASYSTAYITPSLYQLYSPYGNLDLTPEENSTVEAGFEVSLLDKKLTLNTVAYYRQEDNAIGFYTNPTTYKSNYVNTVGKYNARGVEAMVSYAFSKDLGVNVNYTFTQVEEALSKLIPKHKANASVDYQLNERTSFNVNYQYVDKRNTSYFNGATFKSTPVLLDAYQLVNATARYNLIKNRMNVFGSVTNIFNEDFLENVGYSTRGRNFKIGFTLLF